MEDGILLWVEANDRSYCLFVDDLIGEQQVVVKPLPAFLSEFNLKDHGITGCTIMGDGNISIILDCLHYPAWDWADWLPVKPDKPLLAM